MNYKVLYRKYRPSNFDSLIGQNYTRQMLLNIIDNDKVGHAYIFTGPRGTGKTSSAKLFAKAINCLSDDNGKPCGVCDNCNVFSESPDIIEIDAASNNGVDEIRNLIDNVKLSPTSLKYKVYIIDEVHMLTTSAFNALLLTLEEPPSHVVFILATTDIQNVPITILSRCQRFDFRPIDNENIIDRLKFVAKEESISITDDALNEIAYIASGGMRDALSMLDQLSSNDNIDSDIVIANFGTISTEKVSKFIEYVLNDDIEAVLEFLRDVKSKGVYYSVFLEKIIDELKKKAVLIKSGSLDGDFDLIFDLIFGLNDCLSKTNININPYTLIEMIFLKSMNGAVSSVSTVNREIKKGNEKEITSSNISIEEKVIEKEVPEVVEVKEVIQEFVDDTKTTENDIEIKVNNASINLVDSEDAYASLKKIRVNNCFVGVNKVEKERFTSLLSDLINYLNLNDRSLMSLLADCEVVAASTDYVMISSGIDSTNMLINKVLNKIEDVINKEFKKSINLIALTASEWNDAKKEYMDRTKSGIKYVMIDEAFEEDIEDDSGELEKLALEIFGSDNIQFD